MKTNEYTFTKGSRIFILLLFVFIYSSVSAISFVRDTIIVDGEIIYIEKRMVKTDIDSLEEKGINDVKDPPVFHAKYLSIYTGVVLGRVQTITDNDTLETLSAFLGKRNQFTVNPLLSIQGTWMFTDQIGISTGFEFSRTSAQALSFSNGDLASDQSRYRFENRNGELWQYYTYQVGPGFETDTTQIALTKIKLSSWSLGVPLAARFFLSKPQEKRKYQIYSDLGVNFRWNLKINDPSSDHLFLLNSNGYYISYSGIGLVPKTFISTVQWKLGFMLDLNSHWRFDSQFQLNFPPYEWNDFAPYSLRISDYTLRVGITRFFGK